MLPYANSVPIDKIIFDLDTLLSTHSLKSLLDLVHVALLRMFPAPVLHVHVSAHVQFMYHAAYRATARGASDRMRAHNGRVCAGSNSPTVGEVGQPFNETRVRAAARLEKGHHCNLCVTRALHPLMMPSEDHLHGLDARWPAYQQRIKALAKRITLSDSILHLRKPRSCYNAS